MSENKNVLNGVMLFVAGVVVGGVLGVLFAPQSGKDTRKQIKKWTDDAKEKAQESFSELVEKGENLVEKGKERYSKIKKAVTE
ncbi:MAG: hypothetical protein A2452_10905 [Candidatus Firestonebacteria bacterium RIFOXYC2_FULL_39_67]|nr:MAG: hypothetical protein A2536_08805 [Candidatus Firestonebacteria bacterium RIFOXYD2_FULL_39_29]OGF55963.1 MAG: hypothetical protein A2452_10905 [Candidatus Firestonebacteria bacterium RIFOXYC2_FULL_39_67]OGF57816.1 MAG: hypothetical protein A2497_01490 [Candidatus Firestonebacteria bacterium RifOxyC12_full_39_7]